MKNLIVLILLVIAAGAAYQGYELYQEGNKSVSVLGLDISASDQETTQEAYLYFGGAAVALVLAGLALARK